MIKIYFILYLYIILSINNGNTFSFYEILQIHRESARIEAGFREYMHRADPDSPSLSCTLIIAHANVIRYFVCRVLQFPADGWLRLALNHASITWVSIKPDGCVKIRCLGDTGHMPVNMITNGLQNRR